MNNWISVKKQMPSGGQMVLVACANRKIYISKFVKAWGFSLFEEEEVRPGCDGWVIACPRVTHWQPMPRLPRLPRDREAST